MQNITTILRKSRFDILLITAMFVLSLFGGVLIQPITSAAENQKYYVETSTVKTPNTVNKPLTVYYTVNTVKPESGLTIIMQIYKKSNGQRVTESVLKGASLSPTRKSMSVTFTPDEVGTYNARMGMFNSAGVQVYWNVNLGNLVIDNGPQAVTPEPTSILRSINSGGVAASGWNSDNAFTGGNIGGTLATIDTSKVTSPPPSQVYRNTRYGNFTYNINNLTVGKTYKIRLHLNDHQYTSVNERVFNVLANGQPALNDMDIIKESGGKNIAITKDISVTVPASGSIVLKFNSVKNDAIVSGIQLIGPSSAATKTNGIFKTQGTKIIDPNGKEFVPIGANLGAMGYLSTSEAKAEGHVADAKEWGWNTIRLTIQPSDSRFGSFLEVNKNNRALFYSKIDAIVQEYTSQGIVVMLDAHENANAVPNDQYLYDQIDLFWKDMAAKYKNNSYVWFNIMNEPTDVADAWIATHDRFSKTIRSQGAPNIMVYNAPQWGQDITGFYNWIPGSFAYAPKYTPALAAKYGNVVLSQHNYGGDDRYTTIEKYSAYIDNVHAAGIPLLVGEIGFSLDKTTTAGSYAANYKGAQAVFGAAPAKNIGILWWNPTNLGDKYSLKKKPVVVNGVTKMIGASYYDNSPGTVMTEAGQRMWNLGRPDAPVTVVPQGY